jgi:Homeodomain-like domain
MSAGQREVLESLARSQSGAHREVVRAKALLMVADCMANTKIAASLSVSPASVKSWRDRFAEEGLAKLGQIREGRGRKPSIPQSTIDEIVDLTQDHRPKGQTHWSCRTMAAAAGVSKSTVQLVWHARGLKPHRVAVFKLSNDPHFAEKLVDVVGPLHLPAGDRGWSAVPVSASDASHKKARPLVIPNRLSHKNFRIRRQYDPGHTLAAGVTWFTQLIAR